MKNHTPLGVALTLLSTLVYALQTGLIKFLHQQYDTSTPVIVFIQSLVCLVLMLGLIAFQKKSQRIRVIKTAHPVIHIFRALFSLCISYGLFYSLKFIPLIDAALLANTAPLMVPFVGWILLSKKINHRLWLPLTIGFLGVILVLNPDSQVFQSAALLALGAGIGMAVSMVLMRLAKNDTGLTNAFYYFLFSTPLTGLVAIFAWKPISEKVFGWLLVVGLLFFTVQISITYALKFANAQIVSSFYLSNILFAAILGAIFWSTPLSTTMLIGIVLTMLGAVLTIRAQR